MVSLASAWLGLWGRRWLPGQRRLTRYLVGLGLGLAVSTPLPLRAAEQVVLEFGPFSRSIATESLERFVQTGEVDSSLEPFLQRLDGSQRENLRQALGAQRSVDLVPISQWFNSPMGDRSLLFLGKLARTEAGLNGRQALRAAIVAAAAEGGLSPIAIVRHFPTAELRLDLAQARRIGQQVRAEVNLTRTIVDAITDQSQAEVAQSPAVDLATLPDLTQPGPYGSRRVSLQLQDAQRDRAYTAEVFVPANLAGLAGPLPVMVFSHGLGDMPSSFFAMAAHVASHGVVVALPEHVGSNQTQKQAMLTGLDRETFLARDFLDRPLDVSFLLDELERLNASTFGGRLDLSRVAAAGHSFGGYTALALGGATIDFDRLARRCDPAANLLVDAALVLECRALELRSDPAALAQLERGTQDERVQLVLAFATVSNLFGPEGMAAVSVPVMVFGGEVDLLAPVVPQQVAAFSWLQTPDRYLYLGENTSHGPDFTKMASRFLYIDDSLEQGIDEAVIATQGIMRSLLVAFAQVYLAQRQEYRPFLGAAYVEAVSAEPFRVHRVQALPSPVEDLLRAGGPDLE